MSEDVDVKTLLKRTLRAFEMGSWASTGATAAGLFVYAFNPAFNWVMAVPVCGLSILVWCLHGYNKAALDVLVNELKTSLGETHLRFSGLVDSMNLCAKDAAALQHEWSAFEAKISEDAWDKVMDRLGRCEMSLGIQASTQKTRLVR